MERLPLLVLYQEASTIVSFFSDPVIKDNGHDANASLPTVLGPRPTLAIGSLGYSLYIGSLWW